MLLVSEYLAVRAFEKSFLLAAPGQLAAMAFAQINGAACVPDVQGGGFVFHHLAAFA